MSTYAPPRIGYLGAGVILAIVCIILGMSGCDPEPVAVNWSAVDGAKHYGD